MPSRPPFTEHEFGPFRYDPAARLLYRGNEPVPLEPKIIDTLEALLERRGQLVEKSELIRRVWPDCVVDDAGLSRNISILRKALGDEDGSCIETVPRRGYRFAAQAQGVPSPPAGRRRRGMRTVLAAAAFLALAGGFVYWQFYAPSRYLPSSSGIARVAVIPVECLSPDLDRASFAEGLASALVAELARVKSVQLISPATIARYRGAGFPTPAITRILGAQVVVEGTAQRLDSHLRISLRLSDVRAGRVIWAENFEVPAAEPFRAQSEVARDAAARIARLLSPTP